MPPEKATGLGPPKGAALTKKREEAAWRLSLEGHSNREIAVKLAEMGLGEVSHTAVHKMLQRVWKPQSENLMQEMAAEKRRQTEALLMVAREAWAAWIASKKPQKKLTTKQGGETTPAGSNAATVVITDSTGDARYLSEYRAAMAEIRDIWGLEAPQKMDLSGTLAVGIGEFEEVTKSEYANWTPAELEELVRLRQTVEERKRVGTTNGTASEAEGSAEEEPAAEENVESAEEPVLE